jgi:hypothetical protein
LQLSLAGDIDTQSAADIATNIMYAMKMPMSTMDEVQASLSKINDLLAYGAAESNTDIKLMSDTFRYVAPLAAVAGMSIEQVTGLTMELAKAGIKGAEAGVALRSGLVRMAKPTKPMIAAFNRLNINMKDFVQYKKRVEAADITSSLLADGYDLTALNGQIQKILDDKSLAMAPQRMLAQIADLVVGTIDDESVREKITDTLQDAIVAGGQKVDLVKLLRVLREKGATITDISQIFDVRMGSRLAAILYSDLDAVTDEVTEKYKGTTDKMAKAMTKGIIGSWLDLTAAVENFSITVAERTGVLDLAAGVLERISDALDRMGEENPAFLKFGTYAAFALAALAPMGFAISGIAAALGLMANPLAWVVGGLAYLGAINFDSIVHWLRAFGKIFTDNLSPEVLNAFGSAASKLKGWFKDLTDAGADGELWGRTAKNWAETAAAAFNHLYDIGEKIVTSRFFTGFQEGFGDAMKNMASVAKSLADAMGPLGTSMQPFINFLNSNAGENIGKFFGEISGYGLGLAVAAAGIGLVAGAISSLASALVTLSGARAGLAVFGALAGLLGLGGGAGAGAGAGAAAAGGGMFAMLSRFGLAASAIAGVAYLISTYGPDVAKKGRKPKKGEPGWWLGIDPTETREERLKRLRGDGDAANVPVPTPRPTDQPVLHPDVLDAMSKPPVSVDEAERRLNDFSIKADQTGQQAKDSLNITATPIVDASSLDIFLAKISRAVAGLASLGGGGGALPSLNYTSDYRDGSARPAGARARGGPVKRGLSYIVGEEGEELFTAGADGFITPNHALGGGGARGGPMFNNTFHVHGGNAEEVVKKMLDALNRQLIRSQQVSMDGRPCYEY